MTSPVSGRKTMMGRGELMRVDLLAVSTFPVTLLVCPLLHQGIKERAMNNKKLSRLLEPNLQFYFLCLLAFTLAAVTVSPPLALDSCRPSSSHWTGNSGAASSTFISKRCSRTPASWRKFSLCLVYRKTREMSRGKLPRLKTCVFRRKLLY